MGHVSLRNRITRILPFREQDGFACHQHIRKRKDKGPGRGRLRFLHVALVANVLPTWTGNTIINAVLGLNIEHLADKGCIEKGSVLCRPLRNLVKYVRRYHELWKRWMTTWIVDRINIIITATVDMNLQFEAIR